MCIYRWGGREICRAASSPRLKKGFVLRVSVHTHTPHHATHSAEAARCATCKHAFTTLLRKVSRADTLASVANANSDTLRTGAVYSAVRCAPNHAPRPRPTAPLPWLRQHLLLQLLGAQGCFLGVQVSSSSCALSVSVCCRLCACPSATRHTHCVLCSCLLMRTATWLERATTALRGPSKTVCRSNGRVSLRRSSTATPQMRVSPKMAMRVAVGVAALGRRGPRHAVKAVVAVGW